MNEKEKTHKMSLSHHTYSAVTPDAIILEGLLMSFNQPLNIYNFLIEPLTISNSTNIPNKCMMISQKMCQDNTEYTRVSNGRGLF